MATWLAEKLKQSIHRKANKESLWKSDKDLIEQSTAFRARYSEDIANKLRQQCQEKGIPWIDLAYYQTFFVIGMDRLRAASPEYTLKQCQSARHPNDLNVAPSVAQSLITEYHTKIVVLQKIVASKKENADLVEVNPNQVNKANESLEQFEKKLRIDSFSGMLTANEQREHLRRISFGLQTEVLPKILSASEPVYSAAQKIMPLALELMQIS